MKYSPKQEEELMSDIWTGNIKDNPLNFVRYVFPWGQEGTPLEEFTGPRKWQEKILVDLTNHIQKNAGKLDPNMFRLAVASGRGIRFSRMDYLMDAIHSPWLNCHRHRQHRTTATLKNMGRTR
jgi:hypothetical protein